MEQRFGIWRAVVACVVITATVNVGGTPEWISARQAPAIDPATLASGLEAPWAVDFAPDGRVFISERPGRIRIMVNGQLQEQPWATLEVASTGEAGLMGLTLDPAFAANGLLYVAYTYRSPDGGLLNRVVRMREDPSTGRGTMDAVLVENVRGAAIHDGGRVRFGPDGKLYWSMGDAGVDTAAQDLGSPLGKIHRMETDGSAPADNPWPGSTVYSYGHRNPQGFAWHPETGQLYATEHGPSGRQGCCLDEVNLIQAGGNYGWPLITGDERGEGLISPIWHSGTDGTWAPGGAAFATAGPWAGSLLFTGLRGQALYRLVLDPSQPSLAVALEPYLERQLGRIRDVVTGGDGSVYILTSNRDGRGSPAAQDDRLLRVTVR